MFGEFNESVWETGVGELSTRQLIGYQKQGSCAS